MNFPQKNLLSKIKTIKTIWGVNLNFLDKTNLKSQMTEIKNSFDGIEIATGFFDTKHKDDFLKICKDLNLSIVTQIHTNGYHIKSNDIKVHLDDFKSKLEDSLTWDPVLINSHSGTDYWDKQKNLEFFEKSQEISKNILNDKVEVCHETHRQRILFNPFSSYQVLKSVPNLSITLDLSHWIVTSERLLNEESDYYWNNLESNLIMNTGMIHARIGTINNIQVVDPEYFKEYEKYYFGIWKKIIENSKKNVIYIDYEYGPEPYLFNNPETGRPFKELPQIINEQKKKFDHYLSI